MLIAFAIHASRNVCRLIEDLLSAKRVSANLIKLSVACWLFNPFTITISTRGSGEALVAVQILLMLRCLTHGMHKQQCSTSYCTAHYQICCAHDVPDITGGCPNTNCFTTGQTKTAAMLLGLAVHWRVYPIIYSLPIMLWLPSTPVSTASKHQVCRTCTCT